MHPACVPPLILKENVKNELGIFCYHQIIEVILIK